MSQLFAGCAALQRRAVWTTLLACVQALASVRLSTSFSQPLRKTVSRAGSLVFFSAVASLTVGCATTHPEGRANPPLMGPVPAGGHLLLFVTDVPLAMEEARKAGFDPVPGGQGQSPHNAMIYLDNGWFVELINPHDLPALARFIAWFIPVVDNRLEAWDQAKPGELFDWSVDVQNIEKAQQLALDNGIAFSDVRDFDREQRDGTYTEWKLAIPLDGYLPFLKSPYINHIDISGHQKHSNGAQRLKGFTVVSPDLQQTREALSRTLGIAATSKDLFCLGEVEVHLEQGPQPGIKALQLVSNKGQSITRLAGLEVAFLALEPGPCSNSKTQS